MGNVQISDVSDVLVSNFNPILINKNFFNKYQICWSVLPYKIITLPSVVYSFSAKTVADRHRLAAYHSGIS